MFKSGYQLFILLIIFTIPQSLFAGHVSNTEITYKHVSGEKYKVIVKLYMDCSSNPQSNVTGQVSGKTSGSITLNKVSTENVNSRCNNKCWYKVHTYEKVVDFSVKPFSDYKKGACEVKFSISGSRGNSITTFTGSLYYLECGINFCNLSHMNDSANSLPKLFTKRFNIYPCNSPFFFHPGAQDEHNDSLSFKLVAPKTSETGKVVYNKGYSEKYPLSVYCPIGGNSCSPSPYSKPSRGMYFDPETGNTIFTPTNCSEYGVFALEITEYRRDTGGIMREVGFSIKEYDINVFSTSNKVPEFEGLHRLIAFESVEFSHKVKALDSIVSQTPVPQDTVQLNLLYTIDGSTFEIIDTNEREQEGLFKWTPPKDSAGQKAYKFLVEAYDDNCTNSARTNREYEVFVVEKPDTPTIQSCGKVALKLGILPKGFLARWDIHKDNKIGPVLYSSVKPFDTLQIDTSGTYYAEYKVTSTGKKSTSLFYEFKIGDVLDVTLSGEEPYYCYLDTIKLNTTVKFNKGKLSYSWFENDVLNISMNKSNYLSDANLTLSSIKILVKDYAGCENSDEIIFDVKTRPEVYLGIDQRICSYESVTLENLKAIDSSNTYLWTPGNVYSYDYKISKQAKVGLTVIDSFGCATTGYVNIFQNKEVVADAGEDKHLCSGTTDSLVGTSLPKGFQTKYTWADLNNNVVIGNNDTQAVTPKQYNSYKFFIEVTESDLTCHDSDLIQVHVIPVPETDLGANVEICNGDSVELKVADQSLLVDYYWKEDGDTGFVSGVRTKVVNPTVHTCWTAKSVLKNGAVKCASKDKICITLNPLPLVNLANDTIIDNWGAITLDAGSSWTSYLWNDNSTNQTLFVGGQQQGMGMHLYWVEVEDDKGCKGRDSIMLTIDDINSVNEPTSIQLESYPSPVKNELTVVLPMNGTNGKLEVLAMDGKLVFEKLVEQRSAKKIVLDVTSLSEGVYTLRFVQGMNTSIAKFVK
jgi:hypothetical protein